MNGYAYIFSRRSAMPNEIFMHLSYRTYATGMCRYGCRCVWPVHHIYWSGGKPFCERPDIQHLEMYFAYVPYISKRFTPSRHPHVSPAGEHSNIASVSRIPPIYPNPNTQNERYGCELLLKTHSHCCHCV